MSCWRCGGPNRYVLGVCARCEDAERLIDEQRRTREAIQEQTSQARQREHDRFILDAQDRLDREREAQGLPPHDWSSPPEKPESRRSEFSLSGLLPLVVGVCGLLVYFIFFRPESDETKSDDLASPSVTSKPADTSQVAPETQTKPTLPTLCGRATAPPDISDWSSYSCQDEASAGDAWSRCLVRTDYTTEAGRGCPGAMRCCPQE